MPATGQAVEDVAASVAKLKITPTTAPDIKKPGGNKKVKKEAVADSWEDEEVPSEPDSGSDTEDGGADSSRPTTSASDLAGTQAPPPTPISPEYKNSTVGTQAPPPTPVTPNYQGAAAFGGSQPSSISAAIAAGAAEEQRRPEKTDAVARRMIASALGVKVPRQTEDQKAYDRALREKERKRREEEREAEKRLEEAEKAKRAIWED